MKYNVVLERLQNLIHYTPTQNELCEATGIKQSAMSQRAARNSNFSSDEIEKINNFYNVDLYLNITKNDIKITNISIEGEIIEIPYWEELPEELKIPDFTCVTAERRVIENHWYLNPDNLRIIPMIGDKMTNYWYPIRNNDILIIDTSQDFITGNGVYFGTSRNNSQFWIREMQLLMDLSYEFKGYAPSGETRKVYKPTELESVDFKLIGKVIKNVSFRL